MRAVSGFEAFIKHSILFQLKYKDELDTRKLEEIIHRLHGTKEFFINKAIGWILREYSKTNPGWVVGYVNNNPLHSLSKRESLKVVNRKSIQPGNQSLV